jgi:hypothetical protein
LSQRKGRPGAPAPRPPRRPTAPGLVLAYIHPGETSAFFTQSLAATLLDDFAAKMTGRPRSWALANVMQEWSSANVSAARNTVTQRFLELGGADWLLWVDADMQWSPEAIDLLVDAADPVSRPIVGGLCFGMTGDRIMPTIYQWAELDGQLTTVRMPTYEPDALQQVAATGAAFLLIHRTALEQIRDRAFNAAFPWFQETVLAGNPVGEDITFCVRAGMCEIPVFVHTAALIGHHKSQLLTADVHRAQALVDAATTPPEA